MKNKLINKFGIILSIILLLISINITIFNKKDFIAEAFVEDEALINFEQEININDNFKDDCVIVVLKHEYSQTKGKINLETLVSKEDNNFEEVEDLYPIINSDENQLFNKEKYRRILNVKLKEKGKDKVIQAIEVLKKLDIVLSVEPDYIYNVKDEWIPSDKYYKTNQWGLNGDYGINMEKAWDICSGQTEVKVGLFETGVQMDHEDLDGRIANPNFTMTDNTHGTHVAGIIGAINNNGKGIAGIAQVEIVPLNRSTFVKSLAYATNNDIRIINASFYFITEDNKPAPMEPSHLAAIQNYDGLLICSAGNDGNNTDDLPQYPAGYGDSTKFNAYNVISVGSIERNGNISTFSNYGSNSVHIFAPGGAIYSTLPNNQYGYMSGTSMAAPFVTGVAALMYSMYLNMETNESRYFDVPTQIKKKIIAAATYQSNLNGKCVANGRLNAYAAVGSIPTFKTTDLGNDSVRIDGFDKEYVSDTLALPIKINGKNVTEIGRWAFANQSLLKRVEVQYNIKNINANAFTNATALENIVFFNREYKDADGDRQTEYNNLKSIGMEAFSNCTALKGITIPKNVTEIGYKAFENCTSAISLDFADDCKLTTIDNCVFEGYGISNSIILQTVMPANIMMIGEKAFHNSRIGIVRFEEGSQLSYIGDSAFADSKVNIFELPASLQSIGTDAFRNSQLGSIVLPNVSTIGANAFAGCNDLTIYTSKSNENGWTASWNSSNRPVVFGCKLTGDSKYVASFTKTVSNPINMNAENGISVPPTTSFNTTFDGWYTTEDFSGTQYKDIATAPNGKLYAKWVTKESCVAEGTMTTLADGSQVAVENLKGDEQLLVWNMLTGRFDNAPILFIDSDPQREYDVINLRFSDGTTVKVISEHAFWDFNLNEYVFLRSDASKYVGHWFNKQITNADGKLEWTKVQLVGVELTKEITTAWSPVTYGHLCYYVNGMLSMPGATEGLINIFEVDSVSMKVDEVAFVQDIETYGLFTYEEFAELLPVPEYVFEAFGGQYIKVAIGKGLTSIQELSELIQRYEIFFN